MYKVHDGCFLDLKEVCAVWSENYSDPKLDQGGYLVKVLLKNNATILTIANYATKSEADKSLDNFASEFSRRTTIGKE